MGGGTIEPGQVADQVLKLRVATKEDIDAITRVVVASFPDDPGCDYKYPYRHEYPQDFWNWTRLEYASYINQPDKFATLVMTTLTVDSDKSVVETPIAVGVWDISVKTKANGGDNGIHDRRDANPEHMRAYGETMSRSFEKYFEKHGNEQIHLWMLMTHPDFRRRGAGTTLCNWGRALAMKKGGWMLTLMASPMGKELYQFLGYKLLGTEVAHTDGEKDKVDIFCMEMHTK